MAYSRETYKNVLKWALSCERLVSQSPSAFATAAMTAVWNRGRLYPKFYIPTMVPGESFPAQDAICDNLTHAVFLAKSVQKNSGSNINVTGFATFELAANHYLSALVTLCYRVLRTTPKRVANRVHHVFPPPPPAGMRHYRTATGHIHYVTPAGKVRFVVPPPPPGATFIAPRAPSATHAAFIAPPLPPPPGHVVVSRYVAPPPPPPGLVHYVTTSGAVHYVSPATGVVVHVQPPPPPGVAFVAPPPPTPQAAVAVAPALPPPPRVAPAMPIAPAVPVRPISPPASTIDQGDSVIKQKALELANGLILGSQDAFAKAQAVSSQAQGGDWMSCQILDNAMSILKNDGAPDDLTHAVDWRNNGDPNDLDSTDIATAAAVDSGAANPDLGYGNADIMDDSGAGGNQTIDPATGGTIDPNAVMYGETRRPFVQGVTRVTGEPPVNVRRELESCIRSANLGDQNAAAMLRALRSAAMGNNPRARSNFEYAMRYAQSLPEENAGTNVGACFGADNYDRDDGAMSRFDGSGEMEFGVGRPRIGVHVTPVHAHHHPTAQHRGGPHRFVPKGSIRAQQRAAENVVLYEAAQRRHPAFNPQPMPGNGGGGDWTMGPGDGGLSVAPGAGGRVPPLKQLFLAAEAGNPQAIARIRAIQEKAAQGDLRAQSLLRALHAFRGATGPHALKLGRAVKLSHGVPLTTARVHGIAAEFGGDSIHVLRGVRHPHVLLPRTLAPNVRTAIAAGQVVGQAQELQALRFGGAPIPAAVAWEHR